MLMFIKYFQLNVQKLGPNCLTVDLNSEMRLRLTHRITHTFYRGKSSPTTIRINNKNTIRTTESRKNSTALRQTPRGQSVKLK